MEEEVRTARAELRSSFHQQITQTYEYRLGQLEACGAMIKAMEADYVQAVAQDHNKHPAETISTDHKFTEHELGYTMQHLKTWMQDVSCAKDIANTTDSVYLYPEPKGTVLIIGAWNYPIQLAIGPLIGAIAAGNCAIVKPSEMSPSSTVVMKRYFDQYMDQRCYRMIPGDASLAKALLELQWDHVFFTGSSRIGKIVAVAAAQHLTPCTLELGGKCPVIVAADTNLTIAAKRIVWGKCVNAGQTCIAPDYVYCPKDKVEGLVKEMKLALTELYTDDIKSCESFPRIINSVHFERLKGMMDHGTVVIGGESDASERYISPTVLTNPSGPLLEDEIFGPVLPIVDYTDMSDVLEQITSKDKPLVCYLFSSNSKLIKRVRTTVSAGTFQVNDTLMHMVIPSLPFGGVGNSGMGKYHGKASFDTFTHYKSVLHRSIGFEGVNALLRYPPYTEQWKQDIMFKLCYYKPKIPSMVLRYTVSAAVSAAGLAYAYTAYFQ